MKAIEILQNCIWDMDECDEAIEEIKTLQQELKQGQENYNMIWNMYSQLRRENHKPKKSDTYTYKKKENK